MIKISFNKNAKGVYSGFRCEGHAGYGKSGQDIICAAVSVLVINTVNSIEAFASDVFDFQSNEEDGMMEFHILSDEISDESQLLLRSLVLGLQAVKEGNGDKYIKLKL